MLHYQVEYRYSSYYWHYKCVGAVVSRHPVSVRAFVRELGRQVRLESGRRCTIKLVAKYPDIQIIAAEDPFGSAAWKCSTIHGICLIELDCISFKHNIYILTIFLSSITLRHGHIDVNHTIFWPDSQNCWLIQQLLLNHRVLHDDYFIQQNYSMTTTQ